MDAGDKELIEFLTLQQEIRSLKDKVDKLPPEVRYIKNRELVEAYRKQKILLDWIHTKMNDPELDVETMLVASVLFDFLSGENPMQKIDPKTLQTKAVGRPVAVAPEDYHAVFVIACCDGVSESMRQFRFSSQQSVRKCIKIWVEDFGGNYSDYIGENIKKHKEKFSVFYDQAKRIAKEKYQN